MDLQPGNVAVDGMDPDRPARLLIIGRIGSRRQQRRNDQWVSWDSTVGRAGGRKAQRNTARSARIGGPVDK